MFAIMCVQLLRTDVFPRFRLRSGFNLEIKVNEGKNEQVIYINLVLKSQFLCIRYIRNQDKESIVNFLYRTCAK